MTLNTTKLKKLNTIYTDIEKYLKKELGKIEKGWKFSHSETSYDGYGDKYRREINIVMPKKFEMTVSIIYSHENKIIGLGSSYKYIPDRHSFDINKYKTGDPIIEHIKIRLYNIIMEQINRHNFGQIINNKILLK